MFFPFVKRECTIHPIILFINIYYVSRLDELDSFQIVSYIAII